MDKKKRKNINISIITTDLIFRGGLIIFLYCLIASLVSNHFPLFALGILSLIMAFEFLIINLAVRIQKLELQQKGEW